MTRWLVFVFFVVVYQVSGDKVEVSTAGEENATRDAVANSTEAATKNVRANDLVYVEMITCALRYDTACLVGVAEDYLDIRKQELLAQADAQVARSTGRSDSENTPSQLAKTVEKLITDLSDLFKNGLSGLFSAREGDDEIVDDGDDKDEEEDEENQKIDSKDVGVSRELSSKKKKKKKGPLKKIGQMVRVGVLAAVVIIKIALVIKVIEVALKFKLLLVGLGSLFMQAIKFWLDFKKKDDHGHGHDSGTILYKNSPYESGSSGVEWSDPGVQGEYHGRSFVNTKDYAQRLAYSQHKK